MRRTMETARQLSIAPKRALATALGLVVLTGTLTITRAADCPLAPQQHLPQAPPPPLNIDKVKDVLLAYQAENYDADVAAVFAAARAYIEGRAGQVSKPALVFDIDETSLSNWSNLKANNFGFIADGACDRLPSGPCGFKAWILQGRAISTAASPSARSRCRIPFISFRKGAATATTAATNLCVTRLTLETRLAA